MKHYYHDELTLKDLNEASLNLTLAETKEMVDKIDQLIKQGSFHDKLNMALAADYARLGYLAALCQKVKPRQQLHEIDAERQRQKEYFM